MVNILTLESEKFCRKDRMRIVSRGISLLVNMAGKTSWLEQVLKALSADEKIYLVNIATGFLNLWNHQTEPLLQNFIFF